MRKIRASVLRKVEESRLTNKELTVFLHICQYQTDAGTVSGIYYKDICIENIESKLLFQFVSVA